MVNEETLGITNGERCADGAKCLGSWAKPWGCWERRTVASRWLGADIPQLG
jgi:hypothetical protein